MHSGLAAAVMLAAAPLAAQDNGLTPAAPPAAENIGPRELSNFSLDGTVTRSAQPAATAPVQAPPPREAASAQQDSTTQAERAVPARAAAAQSRQPEPQRRAAIDPISSRPTLRQPSSTTAASTAAAAAPAFSTPLTNPAAPIKAPGGFSPLPWIAALLLLGAGAVIYFGLQRRNRRVATAASGHYFEAAPEPQPAPVRAPAPPQPLVRRPAPEAAPAPVPRGVVTSSLRSAPTSAAQAGAVTSSLRPWIEVELEPSQALVNDEHAAIAFDVTLYNSGSAPARDVAIEACLINAGQQQDAQLTEFYKTAGQVADKIPAVAPMARITLKSAVRLSRSAVQEYEVEGRKLFMPMVAISSRYRWSSGEGQSAASFLVGKAANDSAKLAPLRLDQGSRGWKSLAARRYEKGIRR
jgi:hypothetical protein